MSNSVTAQQAKHSGWIRVLVCCAGLLGACGIGLGAAGAHAGGGELARTASAFLLVHAVAVIALAAIATQAEVAWPFCLAATLLCVGVAAFAGDVASVAFTGGHLVRALAPTGGTLMLVGWLAVTMSALFRRKTGRR